VSNVRHIAACMVRFKRKIDSPWETGVAVTRYSGISDVSHIIDMDMKIVPVPLHNYNLVAYEGCFTYREEEDDHLPMPNED
jgi:hypothetical protein